jgi:uncharacterized membrane protein (UPF0127 family)
MSHTVKKIFKPEYVIVAIGVIIFIVGSSSLWLHRHSGDTLSINSKKYNLLVVATAAEQEKGLGGRASLPQNDAMLFPFTTPAVQCFWMKNMEFSLDMVWLNANKQVVHIQSDVSPATYPETFCPSTPAQYVLELNAGQAQAAHLQLGQTLNF